VRVIDVTGEIDLSSVAEVQTHVDAAMAAGEYRLVIDLEHVPFVDSAVLHTLFRALHRVRGEGGDIAIVCVDPTIRRVLDVFGLASQIHVCPDLGQAVAAIAAR
jgi:anti-sigma B factor antagonist